MTATTQLQRLFRLFNTVRHLKIRQIVYQLRYRLHTQALPAVPDLSCRKHIAHTSFISKPGSWQPGKAFTFLNERRAYSGNVNWHDAHAEKLWLYNLHYFDYLQAADHSVTSTALCQAVIDDWIALNTDARKDGWEPYPTSLRIVNWIKYELDNQCLDKKALGSLAQQAKWLAGGLEYHILANHLFANTKALIFAGLFFEGGEADRWLAKGLQLVREQLHEQFLADGAHYERSPMYHAILFEDVLDLINIATAFTNAVPESDLAHWKTTAVRMADWHQQMLHPDGEITFFNDAAFDIASTAKQLRRYMERLALNESNSDYKLASEQVRLKASGFCVLKSGEFSLYANLAAIGPSYQPGHTHADTLSCELSVGHERVLVNSGTSTYVKGDLRNWQRSTAAHNTVEINGENSSDVWDGFRVGRRAQVSNAYMGSDAQALCVSGVHNGYRHLSGSPVHKRTWAVSDEELVVEDCIEGSYQSALGRWFLHPSIKVLESQRLITPEGVQLVWCVEGGVAQIVPAHWYPKFGVRLQSQCLEVQFNPAESYSVLFRLTKA